MKHYKTVNEVKKNLPEILDRINTCKTYFDCATIMLEGMQHMCVEELVRPEYSGGWWTSIQAYAETFRNQMQYMSEIEYLTGLVNRLPKYQDRVI